MAWSTGTFTLTDGVHNSSWATNWKNTGAATILASEFDALLLDAKDGINACFPADGQKVATGNWDLGGYRLTNITASSNTDAGTYGKQVASGVLSGTDIILTLNDSTTITVDVAGLAAGTGGVALTGDQTVAGVKSFTSATDLAEAKFNGPVKFKVESITPSSTPTCDTTAASSHYLNVNQNMTLNFTWPTSATDSELGANWGLKGEILCRWDAASYTFAFNASMLTALTDYEIEGEPATGSGEMSTLAYTYKYIGGNTYAQFTWVSTP